MNKAALLIAFELVVPGATIILLGYALYKYIQRQRTKVEHKFLDESDYRRFAMGLEIHDEIKHCRSFKDKSVLMAELRDLERAS